MRKIIYNQFNYEKHAGEINNSPSMVIPGMSYDVDTLLNNYSSPPGIMRNLPFTWDGNDNEPLPLSIDLTDIDDVTREINSFRKTREEKVDIPKDSPNLNQPKLEAESPKQN